MASGVIFVTVYGAIFGRKAQGAERTSAWMERGENFHLEPSSLQAFSTSYFNTRFKLQPYIESKYPRQARLLHLELIEERNNRALFVTLSYTDLGRTPYVLPR